MRVVNRSGKLVAFRDDSGKIKLKRNQTHDVVGDQHLPTILALPGILPASTRKAAGGKVTPGRQWRVGEKGPELFIAPGDGVVDARARQP